MATQVQIRNFIKRIAPCAQRAYLTLGKVLPSVCIGMACVECAYGTAGSVKHHSYLGFKVGSGRTALKYWDRKFFVAKTKEEYTIGTHTIITDAFRAYNSMQQCVMNFYELLNSGIYSRVKAEKSYQIQMEQIRACGYMTSSTEVNAVIRIIEKYDLTQYDSIVTETDNTGKYYPPLEYDGNSIVMALTIAGVDASFENRKKIAKENGILNYKGTADQNLQMLKLLREGKLKMV